jgi:hypothetical protein
LICLQRMKKTQLVSNMNNKQIPTRVGSWDGSQAPDVWIHIPPVPFFLYPKMYPYQKIIAIKLAVIQIDVETWLCFSTGHQTIPEAEILQ